MLSVGKERRITIMEAAQAMIDLVCRGKIHRRTSRNRLQLAGLEEINMSGLLACVAFSLSLSGCSSFSPFQPNPPLFKEWSKPGASQTDVDRMMLECGYPSPWGRYGDVPYDKNIVAGAFLCMKSQGYKNSVMEDFCNGFHANPAVCLTKSAPRPDKKLRLNGGYCKANPKDAACKP